MNTILQHVDSSASDALNTSHWKSELFAFFIRGLETSFRVHIGDISYNIQKCYKLLGEYANAKKS